jgi:serine phosphatase RsbU (regulator of sigma subunit)
MLNFKNDSFYPFRAFWNRISQKGLKDEMAISAQKKLILTNQVSILMFLFIFAYITILTILNLIDFHYSLLIYFLSFSILLIPFMNGIGFYRLTSFTISISFPIAVLIFSSLTKKSFHNNIDIVYYIIPRLLLIGTLIIPLILIDIKHRVALVLAVLINLASLISYDFVLGLFGVGFGSLPVTFEKYHLINIFIILPYILILTGIGFLLSINVKYEKRVQKLLEDVKEKNIELEQQKNYIEKIHHEITDSINYARRIQNVLLPEPSLLHQYFKDYFILFKPRNVVSGDFYWFSGINNRIIFCLADCTGHGVPGAFMSMLGISFLREIVTKEHLFEPSEILNKLRNEIVIALNQKGVTSDQKDGMDISLFSLEILPQEDINSEKSFEFIWAGANNPCWIIKNGKFEELIPDKMPVGIHHNMDRFKTINAQLKKGDKLYLSTDGYKDQFGGPLSKKFMSKQLRELIIENSSKQMNKQKEIFEQKIEAWRTGFGTIHEQTDDITIVGFEI